MSDDENEVWWEPSANLVASSSEDEAENEEGHAVSTHDSEAHDGEQRRKRAKRPSGSGAGTPGSGSKTEKPRRKSSSSHAKRRARRSEKFEARQRERRDRYSSSAQGARDVLWETVKTGVGKSMTELELEQIELKVDHVRHVECESRGDEAAVADFCLKAAAATSGENLSPGPKPKKGAPALLVLAGSYKRCLALRSALASINKKPVAKLFAKHMKQSDQEKLLKNNVVVCGVGTPARVKALVDAGALKLQEPCVIVVDATWQDVKRRGMLELDDVRVALVKLMTENILPAATETGWPKLCMF